MKLIIQTEFLCSYYWHAALQAEREIMNHKLPRSLYFSITALILWQCTLESYINFLIEQYRVHAYRFKRDNGKTARLENGSIKEKWIYLPVAVSGTQFTLNGEPFIHFAKLVGLRNALVHFDSDKLSFEKDAPEGATTVGELTKWVGTGEYLEGTIYDYIVRYALAGSAIVKEMIQQLHAMLGTPAPAFLDGTEPFIQFKVKH
jgi:hypothetical protein